MHSFAVRAAAMMGVVLTTVATLTSCGSAPTTDSQQVQSAEHNADDVAFVENMMPHHQQAVELSAMVPSRSTNADLLVVAQHISSDQQAEILTFRGLLAQWGQPADGQSGAMTMTMPGMVDRNTMNRLPTLRGNAFDELWISSMIGHHQGALTMAQDELAHGQSAEARRLADLIIAAQTREIARMNDLLGVTE